MILLILSCALAGRGQQAPAYAIPPRPHLPATADTNDAMAYYLYGESVIGHHPGTAQLCFYWANRLNPELADGYYARGIALILAFRADLREKRESQWRYDPEPSNEQRAQVDTLMFEAFTRDPFLYRRFEVLLTCRFACIIEDDPRKHDYVHAASVLAVALKKHPDQLLMRIERAQLFYYAAQFDSAYAELATVRDTLEARQIHNLGRYYQSTEMFAYQMGVIRELQGQRDAARELYARALTENLGFYMAHVHLAALDLRGDDSVGALNELSLAVQLKDRDPAVRYRYAYLLVAMDREGEAMTQLQAAITADPEYAPPYELIGRLHDAHFRKDEALRAYNEFVRRAARTNPSLAWVVQRIAFLAPAAKVSPPP